MTNTGLTLGGCGVASLIFCAAFSPREAGALGFRIPNQDAEAVARGNAFTATADNPSAMPWAGSAAG